MIFDNVEEYHTFVNAFSIIQQYGEVTLNAMAMGDVISATTTQQAPNVFVHTRIAISEAADTELKNLISREAFNNLLTLLNWTAEQTISYEY